MSKNWARGAALALISAVCAWSDTVYLKDGTTMDGKVSQPNANSIAIQVGQGRMVLQRSEVERIEENDKTGAYDLQKVNPMALKHEQMLEAQTGVSADQREALFKVMEPLKAEDAQTRAAAQKKLLDMSHKMDVFKFLETCLPSLSASYVPSVLEVMCQVDPQKASRVLLSSATDAMAPNRAKALELLAGLGDPQHTDTVARGLADPEPQVCIAAAHALAEMGDKRATTMLIEALRNKDKKVQNAACAALREVWSDGGQGPEHQTAEEWQGFWTTRRAQVKNVIDPTSIKPLVDQEALELAASQNE